MSIIKKHKYDFILPFGEACFTAEMMKIHNLRMMSCPFDWMYGATFEERFKIILKKFNNFFNKEDLIFKGVDNLCDAYYDKKTGITFNHDFAKDSNFEQEYSKVAQKYERRISRVLNTINKSKKVLLLYIDLPDSDRRLDDYTKMQDLMLQLKCVYSNADFDLLYIKHNPNLKSKEVIYNIVSNNIIIAEVYNKSTDPNAENWHANFENTACALTSISLKHPILNYINKKIKKLLQKNKGIFKV